MKEKQVLRPSAIAVAVATVFLLSACAGGGSGSGAGNPSGGNAPPTQGQGGGTPGGAGGGAGGGDPAVTDSTPVYSSNQLASYNFTPGTRTQVPFATPTLVSSFNPYSGSSSSAQVSTQYVVPNLTGNGGQDIVIAGRQTQPATAATWTNTAMQIFDWQGGKLVNDTAKWFPNNSNVILGTDPTVQFADFFKTGRTDILVSPSTDMQWFGSSGISQAWLFKNTGSQFNRTNIDLGTTVWGHGATVADLNKSGWMDAIITDYGPNTTFLMNNRVNGFNVYQAKGTNDLFWGTSSVAAADFMGNGSTQIVATDSTCANFGINGCGNSTTKMYSWNIDPVTNKLNINFLKDLPTPILGNGSHNYLVINYDFVSNNKQNLIVFSSPDLTSVKQSAIQFLQNDGAGNFTDVTTTMLKGYNTNTYGSYHPQFVDLGNGQQSMVVTGSDYSGQNSSTQILIKQSATGPYVAAFQNIITDFASQTNLIAKTNNSGNQVAVVKDPSNNMYLVSTVQYQANGQTMMGTYLSSMGPNVSTTTAQTAFNQVKAAWPWMNSAQVNQVLAQTSSSYLTSAGAGLVLNPDQLFNPVGAMSIVTRSGSMPLSGGISGVSLGSMTQLQAFDSVGRNYLVSFANNNYVGPNSFNTNTEHIDQYNITSHSEYLLNSNTNTMYSPLGTMRLGFENRNQYNTTGAPIPPKEFGDSSGNQGIYLGMVQPRQWSFGMPEVYRNGNFSTGLQYTNLNSNPWLNFNGAFGSVTNAGTLEHVATYAKDGFSVQGAVMRTTTNFRPGMVTNVTPITAAWAESGYRYSEDQFGDLGVYLGVKPVVLNGSVTANLPTNVDSSGNTVYTTNKMGVVSTTTPYVRALYTGIIDRNSSYRLSGMSTYTGQYRAMAEYRYNFN
jgi:hypothetical protein